MPNPVRLRPPLYFHASLTAFVSCSRRTISKHRAPPRVLFTLYLKTPRVLPFSTLIVPHLAAHLSLLPSNGSSASAGPRLGLSESTQSRFLSFTLTPPSFPCIKRRRTHALTLMSRMHHAYDPHEY
ncbi:hypothetical protein BC835DRAFT_1531249 [Cytidiella melzeri]|nr:hypothetical protein BC835DRAFT_1531249 [Cytidiella melzeri]